MPKGGSSLTGGTGDVNPQFYRIQVPNGVTVSTTAVTSASQTAAFPVPITRLRQPSSGKTTVMEILKVRWVNQLQLAVNQVPHNAIYVVQAWLSTRAPNVIAQPTVISPFGATDGSVLDLVQVSSAYGVTENPGDPPGPDYISTYSVDNEGPNWHDLTDGAGHGVLVATDNIWISIMLTVGSVDVGNYGAAAFSAAHILYRFKDVSLQEYIGLVQSQQSAS